MGRAQPWRWHRSRASHPSPTARCAARFTPTSAAESYKIILIMHQNANECKMSQNAAACKRIVMNTHFAFKCFWYTYFITTTMNTYSVAMIWNLQTLFLKTKHICKRLYINLSKKRLEPKKLRFPTARSEQRLHSATLLSKAWYNSLPDLPRSAAATCQGELLRL